MYEIIFTIINLIGWAVLIFFLRNFFPNYLSKKAENLATKEDIGVITTIMEKTKLQHSCELESVKMSLASQLHVNQTRYINEYKILSELTEKLVNLRDAARNLRPALDYRNANETEQERKAKRLQAYNKAMVEFYNVKEFKKPFYPKPIYEKLEALDKLTWKEAVSFSRTDPLSDDNYWEKAEQNYQVIQQKADELIELIRVRIQTWEH